MVLRGGICNTERGGSVAGDQGSSQYRRHREMPGGQPREHMPNGQRTPLTEGVSWHILMLITSQNFSSLAHSCSNAASLLLVETSLLCRRCPCFGPSSYL